MGSMNEIKCNNCFFSVTTSDNFTIIVCGDNLDFFNELYCLNCQKAVKVWKHKNGQDMKSECPKCGSNDLILSLPYESNVKCPSCKKGNLKTESCVLAD